MAHCGRVTPFSPWTSLLSNAHRELDLGLTLRSGQSFRWKEPHPHHWTSVLNGTLYTLTPRNDEIVFRYYPSEQPLSEAKQRLENYFQLGHSLQHLCAQWSVPPSETKPPQSGKPPKHSQQCINTEFSRVAAVLKGLRLLRQEPAECLFSFICSQNNNVGRITKMIDALCEKYGELIGEVDGVKFFSFPTTERIAAISEQELRDLGFGYRAKFLPKAAQQILQKEKNWFDTLRAADRESAIIELVAGCIALFSLDKFDVVPVDTHVWQISQRFMSSLRGKTLTPKMHADIAEFWRSRFGPYAGWAHSVLFSAELGAFKSLLNADVSSTPSDVSTREEKPTISTIKLEKATEESPPPDSRKRRKIRK